MKSNKRIICFMLATLLCAATLFTSVSAITANAAYVQNETVSAEQTVTTADTAEKNEKPSRSDSATGAQVRPGFEDVDFGGKTFTFAAPINHTDGWADYEVFAEEGGEGLLDASIVERNDVLFELYNCFVAVEDVDKGTLTNDFATNQNRIDILNGKYNIANKYGDYLNLQNLDIDFTQPWWDQGIINDLTVDGKLYAAVGAYSLTSFDSTWVMFFNKTVLKNNEKLAGVDPYELVKNNEWTLDKFYEIIKKAGNEDGDQSMTTGSGDIYGLVSSTFGIRGLYFGAGQGYSVKTDAADGTSEFNHAFRDTAVTATEKILDIYGNDYATITSYTVVQSQMHSNLTLFAPEVLRMASFYAGIEGDYKEAVDFGILPHPKLSSEQENYKHNVDNHMIYTCVPKTCTDIERIANFLEVYAYHSYFTVYNDYIELYGNTYTKDKESAEMVEIILQSRSFDLAYQFYWAGVDNYYLAGIQEGNNVVAEIRGTLGDAIVQNANSYKEQLPDTCKHSYEVDKTVAATCGYAGYTTYKCSVCGIIKTKDIVPAAHNYVNGMCTGCGAKDPSFVYDKTANVVIGNVKEAPGQVVTVDISIKDTDPVKSMMISDLVYDRNVLKLVGAEWKIDALIKTWNNETESGVMTFEENTSANGVVLTLTFEINERADDSVYTISCATIVKYMDDVLGEVPMNIILTAGAVEVAKPIVGDVDGNGVIDSNDAVYLLWHTFMPEDFPVKQACDFDGNEIVDSEDAIYLLWYTFKPDEYPLHTPC